MERCLQDPKTNDITREFITEFMESTLQGKSLGEYNELQVASWERIVEQGKKYLIDIKSSIHFM